MGLRMTCVIEDASGAAVFIVQQCPERAYRAARCERKVSVWKKKRVLESCYSIKHLIRLDYVCVLVYVCVHVCLCAHVCVCV